MFINPLQHYSIIMFKIRDCFKVGEITEIMKFKSMLRILNINLKTGFVPK